MTGDVESLAAVRTAIATNAARYPAGEMTFRARWTDPLVGGNVGRTVRARGRLRWDRGGSRLRFEGDVEEPNGAETWGVAPRVRKVFVVTPERLQSFTPSVAAASASAPPLPVRGVFHVWPQRWYQLGPPNSKPAYQWARRLSFPDPWTVLQSVEVSREGEEAIVTSRYENGVERVVRASFAVGGNVVSYEERPYRDIRGRRRPRYDSGTYEWVAHGTDAFRLKRHTMRIGLTPHARPEHDQEFELEIVEFETVEGWPDETFDFSLPAGTRWRMRTASVERYGVIGVRKRAEDAAQKITQDDLEALAEDAAGDGFGGGG